MRIELCFFENLQSFGCLLCANGERRFFQKRAELRSIFDPQVPMDLIHILSVYVDDSHLCHLSIAVPSPQEFRTAPNIALRVWFVGTMTKRSGLCSEDSCCSTFTCILLAVGVGWTLIAMVVLSIIFSWPTGIHPKIECILRNSTLAQILLFRFDIDSTDQYGIDCTDAIVCDSQTDNNLESNHNCISLQYSCSV